jgi:D-alanyl-D-alanine carboxypeptidase
LATGRLLKPATDTLRLQTKPLVSGCWIHIRYGLGISELNGFLGHNGAIVGYGSAMYYLSRSRATLIVLGNQTPSFRAG